VGTAPIVPLTSSVIFSNTLDLLRTVWMEASLLSFLVRSLRVRIVTSRVKAPYFAYSFLSAIQINLEGVPHYLIIRGGHSTEWKFAKV
jgi:hypothetical protein